MTDTYFDDGTHLTSATLAGTEAIPMRQAGGGDAYTTPVDLKGYFGVISNASTITTGNLTCAENNVYNCTIAGLTADRNAVLPAPSAAGKQIRLNILDGDATYALIIIGDTGVTVNGGSAATEWSRLFIAGESVTLESTSTSNWNVVTDKRRKCFGVAERQSAQSIDSKTSPNTKILLDASIIDIGGIVDVATNNRINIRRAGNYRITGHGTIEGLDDAERLAVWIAIDGTPINFMTAYNSATSALSAAQLTIAKALTAGQYIELEENHNEGTSQNTSTSYPPFLMVEEVL